MELWTKLNVSKLKLKAAFFQSSLPLTHLQHSPSEGRIFEYINATDPIYLSLVLFHEWTYPVKSNWTMKVLRLDQETLKLLGIISSVDKSYYLQMIISQYVCLVTPILLLLPSIAYFVVNIRDVAAATSAFYLLCIIGMGFVTYSEYWLKRSTVLSLLRRIQELVDESCEKFKSFYMATESLAFKIVYYFKIFVFCSVFSVVSVPLIVLIFMWITNDYSDEMRILPASLL